MDISREANAELSLQVEYSIRAVPTASVILGMDGASVPITDTLRSARPNEWKTLTIPLRCFATAGADMAKVSAPLVLGTSGRLTIAVSDIRIASAAIPQDRCSF
jgi:beta-glucosidase